MGNGGYDVISYKLDLSYDPQTDFLRGTAAIRAKTTESLSRFNLDLQGLQVKSVTVRGSDAEWSRAGVHELVITPSHPLREHTNFRTVVRYEGVPTTLTLPGTDDAMGFIPTSDGAVIAGEPEVAATWYPVNDHPLDKATYTFIVSVPAGLSVVANGRFVAKNTSHGWSTWRWREDEPMASYLATATIGRFRTQARTMPTGIRIYNAIDPALFATPSNPDDPSSPSLGQVAQETFGMIPRQLRLLSSAFGPYPFTDAGGIADDAPIRFALENQTRPIYAAHWFEDPFIAAIVQVHVWLNEGFATYSEWLWLAYFFDDPNVPQYIFDDLYTNIPPDDEFWKVVIADPKVDNLFSDPVYTRGGMALQALRVRVGDDRFFGILKRWAAEQAGGNGTTREFVRLAENVSGQNLDSLFDAWLFTPSKPTSSSAAESLLATASPASKEQGGLTDYVRHLLPPSG
jgi:aminopeptidase N